MSYKARSEKLIASVGKRWMDKIFTFSVCGRRKRVVEFISLFMLICCLGRAAAVETESKVNDSEVWVDVKLKGAERLDEIIELKKRITELEALERKARLEKVRLEAERNLLKQELFDAIKQMETQNARFRQLEQSVAGLLADGNMPKATVREAKLVEAVAGITKSGQDLAVLSAEFCNEADAIVKSLPAGNLEGVRLRLKIDEVRSASRKFITLSDWKIDAKPVEKCRIAAVNTDLEFVVLPVGAAHGVFNGLVFYVPGKTAGAKPVKLRVFATRSLTAAAQVVDGDIRTLSQGDAAVLDLQQTNK